MSESSQASVPAWIVTLVGRQTLEYEALRITADKLAVERDDLLHEANKAAPAGEGEGVNP